jgi:tRNA(Ile)-lysidine synthase
MLNLTIRPSKTDPYIIACSGGSDSMAAVSFLHQYNRIFSVAYFHHATPQAPDFQSVVERWCSANKHPFLLGQLTTSKPKDQSPEEHWRNERYKFLLSYNLPVVTAHHLNDVMETWLFGSIHGNPKLIPSRNGLVVRPFLLNTKQQLTDWCIRHNVEWAEDKSNTDVSSPRNRIRHIILPEVLKINPGFAKVIRKKLLIAQQKEQ